jgi:hypothetical protein
MPITDFLKAEHPPEDLAAALRVLLSFKGCESQEEYIRIPFLAWTKLEQLQEFPAHRVEGAPLKPDTLAYIEGQQARAAAQLRQEPAREPPDAG